MSEYVGLAQVCFSLLLFLLIWYGPWQAYRTDEFRSELRRIRDRLFDYMAENELDFSDPAYSAVRQALNGMIRAAGSITIGSFLVIPCLTPPSNSSHNEVPRLIDQVKNPRLKSQLRQAMYRATVNMIIYLFTVGTFGMLFGVPALAVLYLYARIGRLVSSKPVGPLSLARLLVARPATAMINVAYFYFGPPDPPESARRLLTHS